uniref:Uncharacterized protein n=1 Tax=Aegilops tauschii subsp. strangulata TaxID=200361 RepID=A0A453RJQ8_AEGTS
MLILPNPSTCQFRPFFLIEILLDPFLNESLLSLYAFTSLSCDVSFVCLYLPSSCSSLAGCGFLLVYDGLIPLYRYTCLAHYWRVR